MIITCTLNPSVDYVISDEDFRLGELNRAKKAISQVGGKGINVSIIANNLKVKSKAIGFVGGYTGQYIINELEKYSYIDTDFVEVAEDTRINVKLKTADGIETEINAAGPKISEKNFKEFMTNINDLTSEDVLIISGSVCKGLTDSVYEDIAKVCNAKNIKFVVDTTKNNLLSTCKYKPFLVKPNKVELEELFEVEIKTDEQVIKYAKELMNLGVQNVLVSLGADGSILVTKEKIYKSLPINLTHVASNRVATQVRMKRANPNPCEQVIICPFHIKGIAVNSVGAGDSMVSGFICKYIETKDFEVALKFAAACGTATAFSKHIATLEDINNILENVKVL